VNVVIVNKNILGKVSRKIPTMLDYREHIAAGSMVNTPPVFAIYVCMLTLRWLKNNGGIPEAEKRNAEKAALMYDTIDRYPLFKGTVAKEDRSIMNACFVMEDKATEQEFLQLCKDEGIVGITGHRSVGGFRASMYNALPLESVVLLTDLMKDFAEKRG
jgi:phosphoserine aminotransferase